MRSKQTETLKHILQQDLDLDAIIWEKELYKRPDITLCELGHLLFTNRTYISRYINQKKNMKYADYMNKFRLDKADLLIADKKYMDAKTLESLSTDCGFKSVSSFRRWFLIRHNCTPKEYLEQLQQQKKAEE